MLHEDDEERTGGCMFIADDNESDCVIASIAPAVEDEEINLEEMGVGRGKVGGIIAERIVHVDDGVVDKIIDPSLRRIRERQAIQIGLISIRDVYQVGQLSSSGQLTLRSDDLSERFRLSAGVGFFGFPNALPVDGGRWLACLRDGLQ